MLTYYANYTTQADHSSKLLESSDGQCGAWAELMMGTLTAAWVSGMSHLQFFADQAKLGVDQLADVGFLVKAWEFNGSGSTGDSLFPYYDARTGASKLYPYDPSGIGYKWLSAEVNQDPEDNSFRGQGNLVPAAIFGNHQLVEITNALGTTYYDPSYGATYGSLDDFASRAVDGYYIVVKAPNASGNYWYEFRRNSEGANLLTQPRTRFYSPS